MYDAIGSGQKENAREKWFNQSHIALRVRNTEDSVCSQETKNTKG